MILSKERKIEIIKQAIFILKLSEQGLICPNIIHQLTAAEINEIDKRYNINILVNYEKVLIHEFPEIYKQRPNDISKNSLFWFCGADRNLKRINVLENALKEIQNEK